GTGFDVGVRTVAITPGAVGAAGSHGCVDARGSKFDWKALLYLVFQGDDADRSRRSLARIGARNCGDKKSIGRQHRRRRVENSSIDKAGKSHVSREVRY